MARIAEDFQRLFEQLSPRGLLWQLLPGSIRHRLHLAWGDELARASQRQDDLLREALPSSTDEMLSDWEATLALVPGAGDSLDDRRKAVIAKLLAGGNQSVQFYEELGDVLGHIITIKKFRPRLSGDPHGEVYRSAAWRWGWLVISSLPAQDIEFEALVRSLSPAHIVLAFQYGGV